MLSSGRPSSAGSDSETERGWQDVRFENCDWPKKAMESPLSLGCCFCSLIVLAVLAVLSLDAVPPLFVGIKYNSFNKMAETDVVFKPGRYFVGPFKKFLLFPSSAQTIEFSNMAKIRPSGLRFEPLHTRTKEGLGLHIQVSVQYRLIATDVGKLYNEFNTNYESVFISSLRDTLIKAASEFDSTSLWVDRQEFGNAMQKMVDTSLHSKYADCWGLQVMVIDLPDTYEHSIVLTQVQNQMMQTRSQEQIAIQIKAQTSVIEAEYAKQSKVIRAKGLANYTVITKTAAAEASQNKIDVTAEMMNVVRMTLGMVAEDLVTYQQYAAIDELLNSTIFYGFDGASQMLVPGMGKSPHGFFR